MIDEFENSAVDFQDDPLVKHIKANIETQTSGLQGSIEHLDGYQRAQFLLHAHKLTGLELKRLQNYIDSLPRDSEGRVTDPAYAMIGGDALHTFIMREIKRIRYQINRAKDNQKELGATEKQDVKPSRPPKTNSMFPRVTLGLAEQLERINKLIIY